MDRKIIEDAVLLRCERIQAEVIKDIGGEFDCLNQDGTLSIPIDKVANVLQSMCFRFSAQLTLEVLSDLLKDV